MNKKFVKAAVSLVLFVFTIVLVKTVDVAAVGPANTQIGLSHLNAGFHNLIGTHMFLYQATNLLGWPSCAAASLPSSASCSWCSARALPRWIKRSWR